MPTFIRVRFAVIIVSVLSFCREYFGYSRTCRLSTLIDTFFPLQWLWLCFFVFQSGNRSFRGQLTLVWPGPAPFPNKTVGRPRTTSMIGQRTALMYAYPCVGGVTLFIAAIAVEWMAGDDSSRISSVSPSLRYLGFGCLRGLLIRALRHHLLQFWHAHDLEARPGKSGLRFCGRHDILVHGALAGIYVSLRSPSPPFQW
jgi:hypothetical protein